MIKTIFIAAQVSGNQQQVESIEVVANRGIVGDRNFDKVEWPGQNITFIELEEIEAFNHNFKQTIDVADTRRNVITQGIRLNDLVGKEFNIGTVRFKGIELCEPCATLGELLSNNLITQEGVIKAFVHKGGLRADVLSDGVISINMDFKTD